MGRTDVARAVAAEAAGMRSRATRSTIVSIRSRDCSDLCRRRGGGGEEEDDDDDDARRCGGRRT